MEALGLDWKLLLAQVANFGLLFVVLKKVLYKPLMKSLDERNSKIESAIKNSQEIESKLKNIEVKEVELLEKARKDAKKEKDEIIEMANIERKKILEEAKVSAKREVEKGISSIEQAKKEAVKNISDEYLDELTKKLYEKLNKKTKTEDYPMLKTLLK